MKADKSGMFLRIILYDETIIHYAKLFLPFSSEISLPKQSSAVVIITASLYLLYTVAQKGHSKNTQQALFCLQLSFKFCANISLNENITWLFPLKHNLCHQKAHKKLHIRHYYAYLNFSCSCRVMSNLKLTSRLVPRKFAPF